MHSVNLTDRTLWYDGDSTYRSSDLLTLINKYDIQYVDELTPIIKEYNSSVLKEQAITVKTQCRDLSYTWNIPTPFQHVDVINFVFNQHEVLSTNLHLSEDECNKREHRLMTELLAFNTRGLFDVLRTLIYVINTLSDKKAVWGVGRGSSVSSYVLFVMGVHDIDSYKYGLDIDDFLHD